MTESRFSAAIPETGRFRRVRPMILALAHIGCAGLLAAQPVHAAPRGLDVAAMSSGDEPVLYLAQASSDYSKLPGKRPSGASNSPPPAPPTGMPGGGAGGSSGSGSQGSSPPSGAGGRVQKR